MVPTSAQGNCGVWKKLLSAYCVQRISSSGAQTWHQIGKSGMLERETVHWFDLEQWMMLKPEIYINQLVK